MFVIWGIIKNVCCLQKIKTKFSDLILQNQYWKRTPWKWKLINSKLKGMQCSSSTNWVFFFMAQDHLRFFLKGRSHQIFSCYSVKCRDENGCKILNFSSLKLFSIYFDDVQHNTSLWKKGHKGENSLLLAANLKTILCNLSHLLNQHLPLRFSFLRF